MFSTSKKVVLTALAVSLASSLYGKVTITVQQAGNNVTFNTDGAINRAGLGGSTGATNHAFINPSQSIFLVGSLSSVPVNIYTSGITGPGQSFGTGGMANPTSASGDDVLIGVLTTMNYLVLSPYIISNQPISISQVYEDQTIESLGLTPGEYTWSWGSGADADSLTLNIVPEPSTYALMTGGLLAGILLIRRRRK